jgi:hypothetical protein
MPFTGLVVAEKEKQTFVVAVFQKSGGSAAQSASEKYTNEPAQGRVSG